jgi:hypothetical protein
MCIGGSNNPVTAEDYYTGYRAEDGSYVGGMKKTYELPSLKTGDKVERDPVLKDVSKPAQRSGAQRRTFFTQYGVNK